MALCAACCDDALVIDGERVVGPAGRAGAQEERPGGPAGGSFGEDYTLKSVLGQGASSKVLRVRCHETQRTFAAKVMRVQGHRPQQRAASKRAMLAEADQMSRLRHPGIVALERYYVEPEQVVLVLELMQGGTLLDHILDRGPMPEHEARAALKALLGALVHLHAHRVVHRDVKPDNVMLPAAGAVSGAKLMDLGFAVGLRGDGTFGADISGTPAFMAPETIKFIRGDLDARLTSKVDCWAAGCVLYMLLGGYPPFQGDSVEEVFDDIVYSVPHFNEPVWAGVSLKAKLLIRKLLHEFPEQRLTARKALSDPWLRDVASAADITLELAGGRTPSGSRAPGTGRGGGCGSAGGGGFEGGSPATSPKPMRSPYLEMQERHAHSQGEGFVRSLQRVFSRNKRMQQVVPR